MTFEGIQNGTIRTVKQANGRVEGSDEVRRPVLCWYYRGDGICAQRVNVERHTKG